MMAGHGKCEGEIDERERKLKGLDWQLLTIKSMNTEDVKCFMMIVLLRRGDYFFRII